MLRKQTHRTSMISSMYCALMGESSAIGRSVLAVGIFSRRVKILIYKALC